MRVCFELEQQFSTSLDLWTPKRFPGADSCDFKPINNSLASFHVISWHQKYCSVAVSLQTGELQNTLQML